MFIFLFVLLVSQVLLQLLIVFILLVLLTDTDGYREVKARKSLEEYRRRKYGEG